MTLIKGLIVNADAYSIVSAFLNAYNYANNYILILFLMQIACGFKNHFA